MGDAVKIGIMICHRYHNCAGGKCLKALKNREGAFSIYKDKEVDLVGYTSCLGCPGVNIENAPAEMKKNGAQVIHLATGLLVGYPPCPRIDYFCKFIKEKYDMDVVIGTHPIPQKYYATHMNLNTWRGEEWQNRLKNTIADEETRLSYD